MNPMEMMKGAKKESKTYETKEHATSEGGNKYIKELINRVFTTRNLVHFAHWNTNSYAKHQALGGLYDGIVAKIDEIVEVYQGKFGLLQGLMSGCTAVPQDITAHIEEEAEWMMANRKEIAGECDAVLNLLDELEAGYLTAIYKLKNLH